MAKQPVTYNVLTPALHQTIRSYEYTGTVNCGIAIYYLNPRMLYLDSHGKNSK